MLVHRVTPILNVSDVTASQEWFVALGWRAGFTWPAGDPEPGFGAVGNGSVEIFLCRGAQGSRGKQGPNFDGDDEAEGVWMSWWLDSPEAVDALHATASGLGYDIGCAPRNEPWGVREFHLRHPDGHTFRVSADLDSEI